MRSEMIAGQLTPRILNPNANETPVTYLISSPIIFRERGFVLSGDLPQARDSGHTVESLLVPNPGIVRLHI